MLFNSIEYAIFLPIIFIGYWFITNKNLVFQNALLLIASYVFYSFWDWRFLLLLFGSTVLNYFVGLKIYASSDFNKRKLLLSFAIVMNVSLLFLFKYYNFFSLSFANSLKIFGLHFSPLLLNIILPVGISFFTFHSLSYIIDIYKRRIEVESSLINYSLFVSFFPLLIAGPIERAQHLLPQLRQNRSFDEAKVVDGLRQILWGLFKKIVIADNAAKYANEIFDHSSIYSGSTLLLGAIFFAFQIYGDFSGYSDIALGTARLFGIELLKNFSFPYFSRDIAEFWRRWHISLTTWFRDYLYIPLGGSKNGIYTNIRNILIVFLVSGFWHGANWTFIVWGLINAVYIIPLIILKTNRKNLDIVSKGKCFPNLKDLIRICFTFCLTVFAWIFFRSNTISNALTFISAIFSYSFFTLPSILPILFFGLLSLFIIIEWFGREEDYALSRLEKKLPKLLRWVMYYSIVLVILYFADSEEQFIYFQF
jgi:alginate O-acetyltransferase complex protein AlgI